jgi:pyruvate dehydrogenase E1 component beta subunit
MAVMTMVQAINSALDIKLSEDANVLLLGEDVGVEGGVFRVTENLYGKYGGERVIDTPLAESGIVGTAVGMCIAGLRPVAEIQFSGFLYPAFNQLVAHVSRMHNRSRGRYRIPMVLRTPCGGAVKAPELHSESMEALLAHVPGLKVVMPSTPYDAKGLLISAIECDDPVIFLEPIRLYRAIKQEVSEEKFTLPLGKAKVLNEGKDITVVAYGAMVREVQKALSMAQKATYSVELIDLRTIAPLDRETVSQSIRKTGRLLSVTEGPSTLGLGSELIALANEEAFLYLEAPPTRLAGFDTVVPYPRGEHFYFYSPDRIFYEIEKLVKY